MQKTKKPKTKTNKRKTQNETIPDEKGSGDGLRSLYSTTDNRNHQKISYTTKCHFHTKGGKI